MTVVAYKDGLIAADSIVMWDDAKCGGIGKIARNKKGSLIGASGNATWVSAVLRWFASGERGPCPVLSRGNKDYAHGGAFIVRFDEPHRFYDFDSDQTLPPVPIEIDRKTGIAIGSGRRLALGAMFAGASAIEAAKAAVHLEDGCGGDIHAMRFRGGPVILSAANGYRG